ncbi:S8 family serine peptidase [Enterococcus sp. MMGLQ5-2]|nr:S8 family serine peptidase [Enterococcus sp. MMGLQ5-2]MBS7583181.1 S8 family serine peptidase [Enterococcus sp. MMGLQ5-1]NPD11041.1 S8 family serine peptidase [Enterococcus sp. MMGLQ5-1]NPD35784.1 S8 family serine peptidase [Enterococcus sp. MMGLQ5-2]
MSHKNKNIKFLILLFGIFSFFGIPSKASAKIIWNNQMPPSNSFSRQSIPADIPNDNEKRRFIIVYHSQSIEVTEEIIEITDKAPIFEYDEVMTGVATEATVEAILEVEKMPEVAYIVEDFKLYTLDTRGNDLAGISAYQALSNDKGSGLAVAVIDDGVNYSHSAFFKTPANPKITSGALDNKGTYISDKIPFSYSYLDSGSKTQTQAGAHGSNVAGIIAADSSNAYQGGIPDAQLINLQALNPANGEGTLSGVIAAVNDAVSLNVDVINMSLGVGEQTGHIAVLENVVNAARSHGIIVACAAGNESSANFYPAPKLDLKA